MLVLVLPRVNAYDRLAVDCVSNDEISFGVLASYAVFRLVVLLAACRSACVKPRKHMLAAAYVASTHLALFAGFRTTW